MRPSSSCFSRPRRSMSTQKITMAGRRSRRPLGKGTEAVVKLLLETLQTKEVDVDSKGLYGWTPLSQAAFNGHEAVVKLLLENRRSISTQRSLWLDAKKMVMAGRRYRGAAGERQEPSSSSCKSRHRHSFYKYRLNSFFLFILISRKNWGVGATLVI